MKILRFVPLVIALGLVAGVTTVTLPSPAAPTAADTRDVSVTPSPLPLACPGPLAVPVGDVDTGDPDLDAGSADRVFAVSPEGTHLDDGTAVDAPVATQMERVATGDIAGLAGIGCTAPRQDQWIMAGSTSLGSSARLVLSNPSGSTVRARVTLSGPVGTLGDATLVTLAPGTQHSMLLEAIEAEVPALAVHVVAGGAGVGAALQDSRLDGFVAAGTDWAGASAPATDAIVPLPAPVSADAPGTLRLIAQDDAEATLTLLAEDGTSSWLGGDSVTLEAGSVTDVDLPATGVAAVRVEADAPVASAALVRVAREAPADAGAAFAYDLAWTQGQAASSDERAVVAPDGALSVVVTATADSHFTLTDQDGTAVVDQDLVGGTTRIVPIDVAAGTVLTSTDVVAWAVVDTDVDAGFVSALTPQPTTVPDRLVSVGAGSYVGIP